MQLQQAKQGHPSLAASTTTVLPEPHRATRWLFLTLGCFFLALGAAGTVLPILPTTPFVLLAAWCFSHSSKRLHDWLLTNRTFGPLIHGWEQHRQIPLRAKLLATAIILPMASYIPLSSKPSAIAKTAALLLIAWGLVFIWTKPSRPPT